MLLPWRDTQVFLRRLTKFIRAMPRKAFRKFAHLRYGLRFLQASRPVALFRAIFLV